MFYNKRTKIGNKEINLTNDQSMNVTEFHKSRTAFAILEDGTLACVINDPREHKVYLEEAHGVSEERFEKLVRGYIKQFRIVFYRSSNFDKIDEDLMPYIKDIGSIAVQTCGHGVYQIWNGVKIGEPGEEWEPIDIPYGVQLDLRFNKGINDLRVRKVNKQDLF